MSSARSVSSMSWLIFSESVNPLVSIAPGAITCSLQLGQVEDDSSFRRLLEILLELLH